MLGAGRGPRSIAGEHTANQEAYDCFLRGRELWWLNGRAANEEAEKLLERAVELDQVHGRSSFATAMRSMTSR